MAATIRGAAESAGVSHREAQVVVVDVGVDPRRLVSAIAQSVRYRCQSVFAVTALVGVLGGIRSVEPEVDA